MWPSSAVYPIFMLLVVASASSGALYASRQGGDEHE
jgi:hypothetical protein